ncbi:indole-3-glycerol phosphate synthase TrpC [Bacillus alkalicola]|uniref:Indole-3-glycerol phosphate synthase n=1 Tax=Evansella alkalicola TaxID=745819 RepID=A0ABS6JZC7_9BACI|nr:indole-3-glycerol phosphate synthase TrpC [Bacillus alkalicola]
MLDKIVVQKKREVQSLPNTFHEKEYKKNSLYDAIAVPVNPLGIIAEVKKASPSKGILVEEFDPLSIAKTYEQLPVEAISVLTDQQFFQGHPDYLTKIKENVNLPILRKDFIIHEKQVKESKEMGADAILLIAAILEGSQLKEYYEMAHSMDLDVLIEVHHEQELEKVLSVVNPRLIGVNNRNLNTFETSLDTTKKLAPYIPKETLFISESGVKTSEDVNFLRHHTHINGLLVGEAFMVESDKRSMLRGWFETGVETSEYST